jgi:DNA-binding transcriptional regulator YiaG
MSPFSPDGILASDSDIPAIIRFLGCDPQPPADSIPGRLVAARRQFGLLQPKMTEKSGVDPAVLMGWEAARSRSTGKSLNSISRVLQIR